MTKALLALLMIASVSATFAGDNTTTEKKDEAATTTSSAGN